MPLKNENQYHIRRMPGKRKLPKALVDINSGVHRRNMKFLTKVLKEEYEEMQAPDADETPE